MVARSPDEEHRASTPLELLFDLCFVVAVSQAAAQLDHAVTGGTVGAGVKGYVMVFFAIWWAWMNFTWFASAYDTDDVAYRLLTFVQIAGVLILAAGVPGAFSTGNFATITVGYVVMRVAMVAQWLRAARSDPGGRPVALRYAVGITVVQAGWVARLFLPASWADASFCILAVAELAVPLWAERAGRPTTWHPAHISERYGLFTLIVLGESVAAATIAIQSAVSSNRLSASLTGVAIGGLVLVFGLWWWYFEHPSEEGLRESRSSAFLWGYAHYAVFASVAALGAGLEVAVESTRRGSGVSPTTAGAAVAISVAAYLVVTGAVQVRLNPRGVLKTRVIIPFAVVLLLVGWSARTLSIGFALPVLGVIVVGLVLLDRLAPALHRGVDDPPTPSLA